jgi:hypothetical protein
MMKDVNGTLASVRAHVASAQGLIQAQTAAANLRMSALPSQARMLGIQLTGTVANMAPECGVDLDTAGVARDDGARGDRAWASEVGRMRHAMRCLSPWSNWRQRSSEGGMKEAGRPWTRRGPRRYVQRDRRGVRGAERQHNVNRIRNREA